MFLFSPVNKGESQKLTLLRGKLWMILLDRLFIVPWLPPSYSRETLLKTLEKELLRYTECISVRNTHATLFLSTNSCNRL